MMRRFFELVLAWLCGDEIVRFPSSQRSSKFLVGEHGPELTAGSAK